MSDKHRPMYAQHLHDVEHAQEKLRLTVLALADTLRGHQDQLLRLEGMRTMLMSLLAEEGQGGHDPSPGA